MTATLPAMVQLNRAMRLAIVHTPYYAVMAVGLNELRGVWHRSRATGEFDGMLSAEARS